MGYRRGAEILNRILSRGGLASVCVLLFFFSIKRKKLYYWRVRRVGGGIHGSTWSRPASNFSISRFSRLVDCWTRYLSRPCRSHGSYSRRTAAVFSIKSISPIRDGYTYPLYGIVNGGKTIFHMDDSAHSERIFGSSLAAASPVRRTRWNN